MKEKKAAPKKAAKKSTKKAAPKKAVKKAAPKKAAPKKAVKKAAPKKVVKEKPVAINAQIVEENKKFFFLVEQDTEFLKSIPYNSKDSLTKGYETFLENLKAKGIKVKTENVDGRIVFSFGVQKPRSKNFLALSRVYNNKKIAMEAAKKFSDKIS